MSIADVAAMRAHVGLCLCLCACAADTSVDETDNTQDDIAIRVRRGVDRAGAFSDHEARLLRNDHGVTWTGAYIGGACSAGSGWTKARLEAIHKATTWQFMPIWVGQQSPAICGAHTLSYARGEIDGREAAARMAALGWKPDRDIPVALDVEAGTYEHSHSASTAYVHGWVHTVHAHGYRAYVYSSPSGIAHFHDAKLAIDGAWVASFFFSGFRSVTPSGLHQIGSRFSHHNRAWQYAGDFRVSGVGEVDASTSDLLLAPGPGGTNRTTTSQREVPAGECGEIQPGEGLERGEAFTSCDAATELKMTDGGELELRTNGNLTWSSGTDGVGVTAVLGSDGNLVVYDADMEPVFETATNGHPGAVLRLDRGLSITDDDEPVWTSASAN
jgi:hypothetical protein